MVALRGYKLMKLPEIFMGESCLPPDPAFPGGFTPRALQRFVQAHKTSVFGSRDVAKFSKLQRESDRITLQHNLLWMKMHA